jgi:hypothetical protein
MFNETKIDQTMVQWLTTKRCGDDISNDKVLSVVNSLLANGYPLSISLFERAYLRLVADGEIKPFKEKLAVAAVPAARVPLSVKEYHAMRASEVARKCLTDPVFKADIDRLIKMGVI